MMTVCEQIKVLPDVADCFQVCIEIDVLRFFIAVK